MNHRGLGPQYEHRTEHLANMELEKGTIVFLGNSITAYCEWAELLGNPQIRNRGIPGDATDGVLERLEPIIQAQPRQIFLMIGINDLLFHPKERVIENYQKIVQRIRKGSPGTALFIQSILPVNNQIRSSKIANTDIRWINSALEKLAKATDNTDYLDLHASFQDQEGRLDEQYTSDGVHLNGRAYQLWKTKIEHLVE